jgi:hypothetical protein
MKVTVDPGVIALGNLVGMWADCDVCGCVTDHNGAWHRQREVWEAWKEATP